MNPQFGKRQCVFFDYLREDHHITFISLSDEHDSSKNRGGLGLGRRRRREKTFSGAGVVIAGKPMK